MFSVYFGVWTYLMFDSLLVHIGNDQFLGIPGVFFQSIWNGAFNWEISTVFVHFGKSWKEYELDKLKKFTLNQHFFRLLLTTSLPLISYFGICVLHIHFLYLKFSLWQFASNWEFLAPFLEKKNTIWHWDWVLIKDPNSLE